MPLAPYRARPVELGHAGPLIAPAVDLDEAFLADAHAAEQAASLAGFRLPQFPFACGRERRRQGLARTSSDLAALEAEGHRLGVERGAGHAQGVGHRLTTLR